MSNRARSHLIQQSRLQNALSATGQQRESPSAESHQ